MKILNFGSLNIDRTYTVKDIVKPGETISSIDYQEFIGGKGLNQSISLSKSGASVWHAGLVGESDGQQLIDRLKEFGVSTKFVEKRNQASGHAVIQIDEKGMNCIIVSGGTNHLVSKDFIDKVLENFDEGDMVLLQNEISNIPYIVERAYEKGLVIALNPSPMDDNIFKINLDKITYFLINEHEGKAITDKDDVESILKEMINRYPDSKTVLTLGEKGAVYCDKEQVTSVEGEKVEVVDTTAAGDTFTGFFLSAVSKGMNVMESMKIANKAAAIATTVKGASNSIPYWESIV